jgi:hypothetical protein
MCGAHPNKLSNVLLWKLNCACKRRCFCMHVTMKYLILRKSCIHTQRWHYRISIWHTGTGRFRRRHASTLFLKELH